MAEKHVRVTPEVAEQAAREIDWARIDAMADEDMARQVAENPDAAPIMTPAQIRAERYRIPLGTLRDWKQGRREPDAAALAYQRVIEREPKAVDRALAVPAPEA